MGEVFHQDVDGVGNAVRALELLSGQDGLVGFDERVERVADDHPEVFQSHLVDTLVDWCDELDERDHLAVEDLERLGRNDEGDRSAVPVPIYGLLLITGVLHSQLLAAPVGEVLFQMGFQGLGSVVISGITFTRMVQHYGPVRSTMITALVPGLSALAAVYFLGEPLYWNLLAGLALVTAGILFGVRKTQAVIKTEGISESATQTKV